MNWDQMRRQYYRTDGTFRDIYATDMDSLAWQKFFELMKDQPLTFHTAKDGNAEETTAIDAAEVERQWDLQEYVPVVRLQLPGGTRLRFFFFDAAELEGTLDPREVKSEARHRELKSFLGKIADCTGKTVKFGPENNREKVYYRLNPRPPKTEAPKAEAAKPAEVPAAEAPKAEAAKPAEVPAAEVPEAAPAAQE